MEWNPDQWLEALNPAWVIVELTLATINWVQPRMTQGPPTSKPQRNLPNPCFPDNRVLRLFYQGWLDLTTIDQSLIKISLKIKPPSILWNLISQM